MPCPRASISARNSLLSQTSFTTDRQEKTLWKQDPAERQENTFPSGCEASSPSSAGTVAPRDRNGIYSDTYTSCPSHQNTLTVPYIFVEALLPCTAPFHIPLFFAIDNLYRQFSLLGCSQSVLPWLRKSWLKCSHTQEIRVQRQIGQSCVIPEYSASQSTPLLKSCSAFKLYFCDCTDLGVKVNRAKTTVRMVTLSCAGSTARGLSAQATPAIH